MHRAQLAGIASWAVAPVSSCSPYPEAPDRGSTDTANSFTELCEELGIRQSMGRVGSCVENAAAETFFLSLECEVLSRHEFTNPDPAQPIVMDWCYELSQYAVIPACRMVSSPGQADPRVRRPVVFVPRLVQSHRSEGGTVISLGHRLLDDYLGLVAARARPNTVLASAYDLKVFFSIIAKDPVEVDTTDVLAFIKAQREPRRGAKVVRIEDGEAGLSARTIKRRLATIAGLYEYLIIRDDAGVTRNPVPRGLAVRRPGQRAVRGVPLIRAPRTLPRVIDPDQVDALTAALRTRRDRAMVEAMLLGGLRRGEVLGLRLEDVRPGECRLFIADGKGGHQRIIPVSG